MSIRLKPYPEYKESGIPWLGKVPAHWVVCRIKNVLSEVDERRSDGTLLSLTRTHGLVPHSDLGNRPPATNDLTDYKMCRPGDLVMNRMQAWSGMFATAGRHGLVSPDYSVFRLSNKGFTIRYFESLFKSPIYVEQFAQRSKGIGTGFNRLYTPDFGAIPLITPPPEEQERIGRFICAVSYQSTRLTRAKRQQIKLLNEQKQVIINQAVTKGLDPNVRMKPSGVEWIGDVPEHWEVRPLKRWVTINRETLSGKEDPDYEFRYIDIGSVGEGSLTGSPRHMRFANAPSRARRVVRAGDTLISTVRPYLKAVCHIESDEDDLVASTGFAVLTPPPTLDGRYLFYSVLSESFIRLATMHSIGASYPAVEPSRLGCLPVALPPTLDEQLRISAYLDSKLKPTQNMIRAERRQIEFLHEYRTRLIADVVTGKLDVRDVELPDIDVLEGLAEWDEEEEIGQEEIIEPEEMDVDEDN